MPKRIANRRRGSRKLLMRPVEDLVVSVVIKHRLKEVGVITLGDLVKRSELDLINTPYFGKTAIAKINDALATHKLSLAGDKVF